MAKKNIKKKENQEEPITKCDQSNELVAKCDRLEKPGGLAPVLIESPSCGSFLCNKVEEVRWKREEGRYEHRHGAT